MVVALTGERGQDLPSLHTFPARRRKILGVSILICGCIGTLTAGSRVRTQCTAAGPKFSWPQPSEVMACLCPRCLWALEVAPGNVTPTLGMRQLLAWALAPQLCFETAPVPRPTIHPPSGL